MAAPHCRWTMKLAVVMIVVASSAIHVKSSTKSYSGYKLGSSSLRMIYYHDQTIAVVEINEDKKLINCELVNIYDDKKGEKMLQSLARINKPMYITLDQMMKKIAVCDLLNPNRVNPETVKLHAAGVTDSNINAVLIAPGTKWCGIGNRATTYFDLGNEVKVDMCCRAHDLCPTYVKPLSTRYDITNFWFLTKSHCICDEAFFKCLKKANRPLGNRLAYFYFNFFGGKCIDTKEGKTVLKYPDLN